jgi:phosphoribosyl 1,2-cyclic phosphodiesterase
VVGAILAAAAAATASTVMSDESIDVRRRKLLCRCDGVQSNTSNAAVQPPVSKLVVLGSGSSTGCPKPLCAILYAHPTTTTGEEDDGSREAEAVTRMKYENLVKCGASAKATVGDPRSNKNYRNNPSFLISLVDPDTNVRQNVIIDVGKTFREGALRWLPTAGIQSIDSIILTHEHMDAAGGLDDVRGFQQYFRSAELGKHYVQVPMPLFLSPWCLKRLQSQFPWLLPPPDATADADSTNAGQTVERHVASFAVTVIESFQPFEALPGFWVTPLPLIHGEDLISFGYAFSINGYNVLYLSDISRMPDDTLAYIQEKLPQPTHLLVLDSLLVEGYNAVHYNLQDAIAMVEVLQPVRTLLVGMNCDAFLPHDEQNAKFRQDYPDKDLQLAYDGLSISLS